MTQQQPCNTTGHCDLCSPGMRNYVRVHIGDDGYSPRLAVCPIHDIAGQVEALPLSLRAVLGDRHA